MPRRRSARLAGASSKPVKTVEATKLEAVAENNEPPQPSPRKPASAAPVPQTPTDSSPAKPDFSEMHPSKAHVPTPGRILGFTDIKPRDKARDVGAATTLAGRTTSTPTPARSMGSLAPEFTFRAPGLPKADLELSSDAQRIMDELRDKAQRIKADLVAKQQQERIERGEDPVTGRRIAMPRGKAGRFSAAHIAEFKKMDSIANHPSAFRAQNSRLTPFAKGGLKRSPSKANLDENEPLAAPKETPAVAAAKAAAITAGPGSGSKRVRQLLDDDVSTSRPSSRDGSFIPRPKSSGKDTTALPRSQSNLASLMSPTKSSLARTAISKSGAQEPSLSGSVGSLGGLPKSRTAGNLTSLPKKEETKPQVISPGRFERVKSMFRSAPKAPAKPSTHTSSAIPLPSGASKTPSLQRSMKAPTMPLTTPARKLQKRIAITPQTDLAALGQNSPLVFKSGIPRSPTRTALGDITYPSLSTVMELQATGKETVSYPDLSRHLVDDGAESMDTDATTAATEEAAQLPPTIPGTFTFRSDHTIRFGNAPPSGFGSSPGQASLRHVRPSILPTDGMPGSFPSRLSSFNIFTKRQSTSSNKENVEPAADAAMPPPSPKKKLAIPVSRTAPKGGPKVAQRPREFLYQTIPHGLPNKKRHRDVAWDEDEEAPEEERLHRAAKKRRDNSELPDAAALLGPRQLAAEKSSATAAGLKMTAFEKTPMAGVAARTAAGADANGTPAFRLKSPSPVKMMLSVPGSRTPSKKKTGLSLSRLNMLARPKNRN